MKTRIILTLVLALSLAGCAGGGALITTNPDGAGVQDVRHVAAAVAVSLKTGFDQFDAIGAQLDTIPGLSTAAKDGYDCAILHVTGSRATPSAAVTAACGTLPTRESSPLQQALTGAEAATTCPGLRATLTAFRAPLQKGLDALDASTNAAVKMGAVLLRAQFALVLSGGVACQ